MTSDSTTCVDSACYRRYHLQQLVRSLETLYWTFLKEFFKENYDRLGLLEFIRSLPAGFDTRLAENGKTLSGGQRQRLAIARALYVEAPVHLFDEPTSALDEDAERRVLDALHELRDSGKIVLLVAHDSRFIPFADQVYTVKNGSLERTPGATRRERAPVALL